MKYLKSVLLVVSVFSFQLKALSGDSRVGLSGSCGSFLDLKECGPGNNFLASNDGYICMDIISANNESVSEKQIYDDIRKNKEATLTRSASITGAVFGVIPGAIYMGNGYFDRNVILGTAGGGIVGGLGGYLYSKAFISSKPNKPKGFIKGAFLGGLAGGATYATAGGLFLVGPTRKDAIFNSGVGVILGGIVGAATGVVVGGISGIATSDYLSRSESSLINIHDEKFGLGMPMPNLEVSSFNPNELQCSFDVVSISF
jgi:hypothetical protein